MTTKHKTVTIPAQIDNLSKGDIITIISFGQSQTFRYAGKGGYPYDCPLKDKYPNMPIFYNDDKHSWLPGSDLSFISNDVYEVTL